MHAHNKSSAKNRASQYMRATLFQQIKNEGIYDESEEEKEDDSFESDISNSRLFNNKKENFELSLISNDNNKIKNNNIVDNEKNELRISRKESDLYDKKSDFSLYSIKTNFKDKENKGVNMNTGNNYGNFNFIKHGKNNSLVSNNKIKKYYIK